MAKKKRFVIEAEIVEQGRDGDTVVRIINGFGDPIVRFASNTLVKAESKK